MARAYAARLGSIAFVFGLLRHAFNGVGIEPVIVYSIGLLLIFTVVGFVIGTIVDELIRQSIEQNFRRTVEKYNQQLENTVAKQN